MAAPLITDRHKHHFHRQSPIKESVRAATTANITISTALNNGDTLDGVTLATDDRVLVKNQTAGAENGIYVVAASPARAYDVSTDDPAFGYLLLVREGAVNAATVWKNTNTSAPTIGSTALTFTAAASGAIGLDDLTDVTITSATLGDRLRFDGSVWANSALIWQPLTDPSVPDLIYDAGDVIMAEA